MAASSPVIKLFLSNQYCNSTSYNKSSQAAKNTCAQVRGLCSRGLLKEAMAILNDMCMSVSAAEMDACVLQTCTHSTAIAEGKKTHIHIRSNGFDKKPILQTKLVSMYTTFGNMLEARDVFDKMAKPNVFVWNAMIRGYASKQLYDEALTIFHQMQVVGYAQLGYYTESLQLFCQMELEDLNPGSMTIASVLPACANLGDLVRGKEIHAYVTRNGFELDISVGTTLVDMYAKCNSAENSRKIFDSMSQRDVASWNVMIAGYVQTGHCGEALKLFCKMQRTHIKPTSFTIASLLPACSYLTTLRHGKQIHDFAIRCRFDCNSFVGSAIIDMYVKCGSLEIARKVFDKLSQRDVICWTTMIMGYALHGFGQDALILFHQMQEAGVKPNYVTFIAVLTACSHSGMTDEAWKYFNCMKQDYLIVPRVEHYACMVDLLGRAGRLAEAYEFIKSMPIEPDAGVWGTLLGACRVHCNTDLGKEVAEYIFELEPRNAGYYVLLSNIYAAIGNWDNVSKLKLMVKDREMKKNRALSWIEVKNSVHAFLAEDR
ncbi:putative pentatricopeptide repeat-containing protein At3g23330 [Cryptomeria japonica]|uniref:putative pentatricopeptide repeat-containing protein At3g23330 n=1 Tax=Cryptomeria japonica TaxID=3369 RepID=UPI0025AD5999|nr:putative pentatricopeptide repeat-containing protein At3g23330 [Cryptomeria japonica]